MSNTDININEIRALIRTGEYLAENPDNFLTAGWMWDPTKTPTGDEETRNRWIYDVKFFLNTLKSKDSQLVFHDMQGLTQRDRAGYYGVMGFLKSIYNRTGGQTKLGLPSTSQSIFIVHGHDDEMIEDVKKVVKNLRLEPIVLREQSDRGKTIIEKLEEWLGNCKCAVVLYTPCDVGRSAKNHDDEKRARQNVVYEHGLFQGYLGRKRIIVLRKGDTKLPGDIDGIIYTSADNDDWKERLSNEIVAIDKNS